MSLAIFHSRTHKRVAHECAPGCLFHFSEKHGYSRTL